MRMLSNLNIKRYPKQYLLIPLISLVGAILIMIFGQDSMYNKSIDIIIRTQNNFNKLFGIEEDATDEKKIEGTFPRNMVFWVFSVLSSNYFYFFFLSLIYNFINVYKTFVLALSIYFGNLVSSLVGLICHQPRPYMVNYNILPFIREAEWGQPSPQVVVAISFYFSLWKIICAHKPYEGKICKKICIGFFFIIWCGIFIFIHFVSGLMSIDQLVVSFLLGFTVFTVMFYIFDLNVNNPAQFYGIVKVRFVYSFVLNLIITFFMIILYLFIEYEEDKVYYTDHLETQHKRFKGHTNYLEENILYSFPLKEGTFTNSLCFLSNIIAILALKIEAIITYGKDYDEWKRQNFDDKTLHQGEDFGADDYQYAESTQWNHTSFIKILFRCIICLVLSLAPFLLLFIPYGGWPEPIKFIIFSFGIYCYYSFGIFFLFKKLYFFLNLNNNVVRSFNYDED